MKIKQIVQQYPWLVGEFTADFGGDPEDYVEVPEGGVVDFFALTAKDVGEAFRVFLHDVIEQMPERVPELVGIDLAAVDWAVVGTVVEATSHDPASWDF